MEGSKCISYPLKNQNFTTKNLQESPQDEAFHQAQSNLQVVLWLDAKLEVIWSKKEQDGLELSFLSFPCCSAGYGVRREREFCFVKLLLEA